MKVSVFPNRMYCHMLSLEWESHIEILLFVFRHNDLTALCALSLFFEGSLAPLPACRRDGAELLLRGHPLSQLADWRVPPSGCHQGETRAWRTQAQHRQMKVHSVVNLCCCLFFCLSVCIAMIIFQKWCCTTKSFVYTFISYISILSNLWPS